LLTVPLICPISLLQVSDAERNYAKLAVKVAEKHGFAAGGGAAR
jgi:hypothetical protein